MKRALLLWILLLVVNVPAHAGGVNLSWDDCGTAGIETQHFACGTNTGIPFTMVGSIDPYTTLTDVVGATATITMMGTQEELPDWWKIGTGACRSRAAITPSADFLAGPYTCIDPWQGQAHTGYTYDYPVADDPRFPTLNDSRIHIAIALPDGQMVPMDQGVEHYVFKLQLARAKSTGSDACTGCTMAACMRLEDITLHQANFNAPVHSNPIERHVAFWHGASMFIWDDFEHGTSGVGCSPDNPTGARNVTWGAIKSLYR